MKQKFNFQQDYIPINNRRQYLLQFPCESKAGPVVLFLHDGPGMAESCLSHIFQQDLAKVCTMVYWDMPGAGKTLTENQNFYPTMDQLLGDLFVVISCLKIKYWKQKIVLLGHGFGSIVASLYTRKRPEDVQCCISAGPIIGTRENGEMALRLLRETVEASGNNGDLQKIEKLRPYPDMDLKNMMKKLPKFRDMQAKYGLGFSGIRIAKLMSGSPSFSMSDLTSLRVGMKKNSPLWDFLLWHSLRQEKKTYDCPIIYILGEKDCVAPGEIAKKFMDRISAPRKQILTIPNAGHFMMIDQPAAFASVLKQILAEL